MFNYYHYYFFLFVLKVEKRNGGEAFKATSVETIFLFKKICLLEKSFFLRKYAEASPVLTS